MKLPIYSKVIFILRCVCAGNTFRCTPTFCPLLWWACMNICMGSGLSLAGQQALENSTDAFGYKSVVFFAIYSY